MRIDKKLIRDNISFRLHWSSEIYSLGKSYRYSLKIPYFLPLLFTSDHGVSIYKYIDPKLLESRWRKYPHLSWNYWNLQDSDLMESRSLIAVVHPWVTYRKAQKLSPEYSALRNGTVFFPVHGAGGMQILGTDDSESLRFLSGLEMDFHPIRICIFHGDLNTERAKKFTNSGFEICTLGDPSAPDFIDNFYLLLGKTKLLVSEDYGSQVPLATEFGIPVQILPRKLTAINSETQTIDFGFGVPEHEENLNLVYSLYSCAYSEVQSAQKLWSEKILGLEYEERSAKTRRRLLLRYLYLLPWWFFFDFTVRNLFSIYRNLRKS